VGARNEFAGAPATLHRHLAHGTEILRGYEAERPTLALVLSGRVTVRTGMRREIFRPGQLLLLPAHVPVDITREPCAESGAYRSVLLEFSQALVERFCSAYPETPECLPGESSLQVHVDPPLVESMGHVFEALLAPEIDGNAIAERRLMEVLLRLRLQGRLPDLVGACGDEPADRVRTLVRLNPAEEWDVTRLAQLLGLPEGELAAALQLVGGLAKIVEDERMSRALQLFEGGNVSVSDVAYACGYDSPDNFAVLYRARHGAAAAVAMAR
jgi:AraC-like DNA-binding protein